MKAISTVAEAPDTNKQLLDTSEPVLNILISAKPWKAIGRPKSDNHNNSNYSDVKDFEGSSYVDDFPIDTSICSGFPSAMIDCRRVSFPCFFSNDHQHHQSFCKPVDVSELIHEIETSSRGDDISWGTIWDIT